MVTKTTNGFDGPRRSYPFPVDYIEEDGMISEKQRSTLTNLIYQKIHDEDECERWLSQMDDMTSSDAEDAIFSFLTAKWR